VTTSLSASVRARRSKACKVSRPFRPQRTGCPFSQGVGLRPRPWAGISRPVGPVEGSPGGVSPRKDGPLSSHIRQGLPEDLPCEPLWSTPLDVHITPDGSPAVAGVSPDVAGAPPDMAGLSPDVAGHSSGRADETNGTADEPNGVADVTNDRADGPNDVADVTNDRAVGPNDAADETNGRADGPNDAADVTNDRADGPNDVADVTNGRAVGPNDVADVTTGKARGPSAVADVTNDRAGEARARPNSPPRVARSRGGTIPLPCGNSAITLPIRFHAELCPAGSRRFRGEACASNFRIRIRL
jgi:hypothetical protein